MISILCPTRNRPENIQRLYDSIARTADKEFEMILYVDNDDPSYDSLALPLTLIRGERIVLSEMWNQCAKYALADIVMYGADDIVFCTPHWDTIVKKEFAKFDDKIAFVFGRDGHSPYDGAYGTHGFVHKNWIAALGYVCPPYFSGDFSDTWMNEIASAVGRHVYVDLLIEHLHPDWSKASLDATYLEKKERMMQDNVAAKYAELAEERRHDIEKLRAVMR